MNMNQPITNDTSRRQEMLPPRSVSGHEEIQSTQGIKIYFGRWSEERYLREFNEETRALIARFRELPRSAWQQIRLELPEGKLSAVEMEKSACAASAFTDIKKYYLGRNFFKVETCIEEALTNHFFHGNRCDPRKVVSLETSYAFEPCVEGSRSLKYFIVTTRDEGEGFDPATIPDPTLPENQERLSGRGIHWIKSFSQLMILDGGRTFQMTFNVASLQG